ncbi:MAG TPA: superoxide dismutase family protein [Candidatus Binatia bacterium]|nr:superoxide dismutase family protein [Candidatus Binatia bacterium]
MLPILLALATTTAAQPGARPAPAAEGQTLSARARLAGARGEPVGEVALRQTPHGVLLTVSLTGVPPGERAFHIHAAGRCEPTFAAAGGHFNPGDRQHGIANPRGMHAGDLPNLHVPDSGRLTVEILAHAVTLEPGRPGSLLGGEGTALVIHAGPDDHRTDPAGNAGDRIACGVVRR